MGPTSPSSSSLARASSSEQASAPPRHTESELLASHLKSPGGLSLAYPI